MVCSCVVPFTPVLLQIDRAAKQLCMCHLRPSRRSSARKSRLEQHIPNERSIVEKWRYFVDFLHDFQSFSFQRRFIYLRGILFSRPYRWKFRKVRDFFNFIDPLLRIVSLRAAFSRHGRFSDFVVKFRFVFRYEAVVFRRYVLALLSVSLLQKFEAYLVYLSLIWNKNPRPFIFFKNSAILLICCYGFTLSSPVFPRELMTYAVVSQLCPANQ